MTRQRLIGVFRLLVGLVVVVCLAYTVWTAAGELSGTGLSLAQIKVLPLVLAIGCYMGAMTLSGLFWYRVLLATGNRPSFGRTMLAFFASQFGKYVPGKAMVVVIRTDMVRGPGVQTGTAAATVFVETLTWIFVGSAIASLLLVLEFKGFVLLQWAAAGMMLAAGLLTWPPVFRWIAGRLLKYDQADNPMIGLTFSVMLFGWSVMTLAWMLNGLSLWLVTASLPIVDGGFNWLDYRLCLASVSLATVAGFVSLLPGGLGVRELVMIPILGMSFGSVVAVIAAILIRFVWLASELITSGIIYGYMHLSSRFKDLDPT
ncbi:MAG: YbhN family protein [Mariniblastus sp.]|nr:YbhN family protein [Mariniblastus sp.]